MNRATDNLDDIAARILAALKSFGAIGRDRARPQSQVARAAGTDTRRLQQATLMLNRNGEPIASTCLQPKGMFIAETVGELQDYAKQLHSRLKGNAHRLKAVNRIIRTQIEAKAVEPGGQRRLCFT